MSALFVARFVKRFGQGPAIEADLRRPTDRFSITVLFGPSGCGKTTTLRCLAGLDRPEEGRITFEETLWFDGERQVFLSPQERGIGYMFQDYALFPHLSVAGNIGYGLAGLSRVQRKRQVGEVMHLFHLSGLEGRYPHQVSGGEQQRIALARVMVRRPRLLLLDEPLSALDQPTREQLRPELRRLLVHFGVPVILVTHDRTEAMALAQHLIVLDRGRVRQEGAVDIVFNRPVDVETARIVGMMNVQPGRVMNAQDGLVTVAVSDKQLVALAPSSPAEEVYVCIRAEEVALEKGNATLTSPRNRLAGVVNSLIREGPLVRVALDCGFPLHALVTRSACNELNLRAGDAITALVKTPSVHLIARN